MQHSCVKLSAVGKNRSRSANLPFYAILQPKEELRVESPKILRFFFVTMAAHQASRVREKPAGDEEATSTLRLGEFQNVPSLTLSEARMVVNAVMGHRKPGAAVKQKE